MNNWYRQAPDEMRFYQQAVTGDTVASATWTLTPNGGVTVSAPINATNTTTVLISTLTLGVEYDGIVHIVGVSGQQFDGAFTIKCLAPEITC